MGWLKYWKFSILLLLIFILAACDEVSTPIPTEIPEIESTPEAIPLLTVGELTEPWITLKDSDSSIKALERRVLSGDNFLRNLYERPFTAIEMDYLADINILTASIAGDEDFFYFTLTLEDLDPTTQALTGWYAIEFDRTKIGRGDLLVTTHDLNTDWSFEHVRVFSDPDSNVGGRKPVVADEGYEGTGYESEVSMQGDRVAYARLAPDDPTQVQFAISRILLDADEFLWGAWADRSLMDPLLFDYNDHFGMSQAGSPIKTSPDYPLDALHSLDNTCRMPFGFKPSGNIIPGMCITSSPECKCLKYVGNPRTGVKTCVEWVCK